MTNIIKFQTPFERIKLHNPCPDIALRKAIITQAIIDATNSTQSKIGKKIKQNALSWIFDNSDDFKQICNEANMESSFVIKITKELIKIQNDKSKSH